MHTIGNPGASKKKVPTAPPSALAQPVQSPPIRRDHLGGQGHEGLAGVEAARQCGNLTGFARQMCYDLYG